MNSVTSLWSMVIAASLTMAALYGLAWPRRQEAAVNLSFALLALVTAGFAAVELWMMKAESPADYALALRWFQVLVWLGVLAIAAFAHCYLRTGRVWLGVAACALRTLTLVPNFVGAANLNYLQVQRIEPVTFLGEQVAVAYGTPNPWMLVGQLSLALLVVFLVDASHNAWRRGERRRALVVGVGLASFVLAGFVEAILVFWHLVAMPMATSPFFLVVVTAMGFELRRDLVGAARLARALQAKDAELRESQERLSLAVEAVDAGLWSIDTASGRLWATDKGRALFHLDPVRDLTLDDVLARIHPQDRPQVQEEIARALATGDQARVEYRALAPDGSQRWLISWGRLCAGPHGQARILTGVTLDLTARKALEDENRRQRIELAHLARAATLSELSGALAHELNQPLTSILSNAEAGLCLLARATPEGAALGPELGPELVAELGAILRDIATEDQRAAEVIRRLRALLRRGEPEPQRLACNDVVQGVLTLLRGDLVDRGLTVELHLHPGLPAVQADRVLLEQVMLNLIANACDALAATPPAERQLTIATDAADDGVLLSVCDNGQGLPTGAVDIFAPFVTTKPQGLGMGLAIARSVASAHHGSLWAEPGPAGGACLYLHLPAAPEPP